MIWHLKKEKKAKAKTSWKKIDLCFQRPSVGGQGIGERWPKGANFQLQDKLGTRDVVCNMMTVVNTAV